MQEMPMPESQAASQPFKNTASDTSKLCMDCGLCCLGALFTRVGITQEELENAPELSNGEEKQKHFSQPCQQFKDGCCSIYTKRPSVCRGYRCQLFKDVQTGGKILTTAQKTVEITQQQVIFLLKELQEVGVLTNNTIIFWPPQHNLRDSVGDFYKKMKNKLTDEASTLNISDQEIKLCYSIFDYYKGINNNFRESSMFNKFSKIINDIEQLFNSTHP